MGFTTQVFLVFLLCFFPVYFLTKSYRALNHVVIVGASCVFYGWWDWRFVVLFGVTTCIDYYISQLLHHAEGDRKRRIILLFSIASNIAMLAFFKYFNFMFENVQALANAGGWTMQDFHLKIILPVGVSFYTFQSMSYTIDVYNRRIEPSKTLMEFLAYVSFFPHMVAGPIQKSTHFLPQFRSERRFDPGMAWDGLFQAMWGLFKKVVIADNLAPIVETIFHQGGAAPGPLVAVGAVFFAIQIYCDFSGYSDIAIGLAKIMGFNLSRNFAYPYFSTNIGEFWRRWHISLTSWFREYVYMPLGGNRTTARRWALNVLLVFILSGIWHGANWTFVIWGAIHGITYLAYAIIMKAFPNSLPSGRVAGVAGWALTTAIVCVGWIFFRAPNAGVAMDMLGSLANGSTWLSPVAYALEPEAVKMFGAVVLLLGIEWLGRKHDHPMKFGYAPVFCKQGLIAASALIIAFFGATGDGAFIYFQF